MKKKNEPNVKMNTEEVKIFSKAVHACRHVFGMTRTATRRFMLRQLKAKKLYDKKPFERNFKKAWRKSLETFDLTDNGNGARFAYEHSDNVRYCEDEGKGTYYCWNDKIWVSGNERRLLLMARETVRKMKATAEAMPDGATGKTELLEWAKKCDNYATLRSMVRAASLEDIAVSHVQFDRHHDLLCCNNGMMNLKTGKFTRGHDRNLLLTQMIPWDYDPDATCELWEEFIDYAAYGDEEKKRFMQVSFGYGLTGHAVEKALFVLQGRGETGKSTFVEALRALLGDQLATQTDFTTFTQKSSHKFIRNDLAMTRNKRVVTASEGDDKDKFDGPVIKALTGGDTVVARFLRQEYFQFKAKFKIFLATNKLPQVQVNDEAAWARFVIMPFDRPIPEDKKDRHMLQKLIEKEISGILNWGIKGAMMYYKDGGLKIPPSILAAKDKLRGISDPVESFMKECCVDDRKATTPNRDFFKKWELWCDDMGEEAGDNASFGKRFKSALLRGSNGGKYTETRVRVKAKGKTKMRRAWKGIRLIEEAPRPTKVAKDRRSKKSNKSK